MHGMHAYQEPFECESGPYDDLNSHGCNTNFNPWIAVFYELPFQNLIQLPKEDSIYYKLTKPKLTKIETFRFVGVKNEKLELDFGFLLIWVAIFGRASVNPVKKNRATSVRFGYEKIPVKKKWVLFSLYRKKCAFFRC